MDATTLHSPIAKPEEIAALCRKWMVRELSLFGSVLREDFSANSDIDVLVRFESSAPWSSLELMTMRDEFSTLFGHDVDLVEADALRNPFRRDEILKTRRIVYAA